MEVTKLIWNLQAQKLEKISFQVPWYQPSRPLSDWGCEMSDRKSDEARSSQIHFVHLLEILQKINHTPSGGKKEISLLFTK